MGLVAHAELLPSVPPCRRLYFIVPDGADSVLTAVQQNLTQLREAEAGALSPHLQPTPGLHDLSQEMRGIDDPAVALPPQAAAAAPPQPPLPAQASTELSAHLQHLEPDGVMPFEFSALEALLMTACTELHTRAAGLQTAVRDALLSLRQTIGTGWRSPASQQLENLRDLKQQERMCMWHVQHVACACAACACACAACACAACACACSVQAHPGDHTHMRMHMHVCAPRVSAHACLHRLVHDAVHRAAARQLRCASQHVLLGEAGGVSTR